MTTNMLNMAGPTQSGAEHSVQCSMTGGGTTGRYASDSKMYWAGPVGTQKYLHLTVAYTVQRPNKGATQ